MLKCFTHLRPAYYIVLGSSLERFEGMKAHDGILLDTSGLIFPNAESNFSPCM